MMARRLLEPSCDWTTTQIRPSELDLVVALRSANRLSLYRFKAKCATCHSSLPDGPTKQGPNLFGIMGKNAAQSRGFKFTKNLDGAGISWNEENMNKWLENPKAVRRAPWRPSASNTSARHTALARHTRHRRGLTHEPSPGVGSWSRARAWPSPASRKRPTAPT